MSNRLRITICLIRITVTHGDSFNRRYNQYPQTLCVFIGRLLLLLFSFLEIYSSAKSNMNTDAQFLFFLLYFIYVIFLGRSLALFSIVQWTYEIITHTISQELWHFLWLIVWAIIFGFCGKFFVYLFLTRHIFSKRNSATNP